LDFNINEQVLSIITFIVSLLAVISLCLTFVLLARMNKFKKAYISMQTFMSGASLESLIKANLSEIMKANEKIASQDTRLDRLESKMRSAVDSAALVRFNSFANMGAELSFSLALLNQQETGVLLTGIHSVEECRLYAKAVDHGQASVKLSQEEKLAIEKACNSIKV